MPTEVELTKVVWWALPIGGLLGGLARSLIATEIEFPRFKKYKITGKIVLIPGTFGNMILGLIAALVLAGSAAATFQFQGGWDTRGFLGPLASSIAVGIGSAEYLQKRAKEVLDDTKETLNHRSRERGMMGTRRRFYDDAAG